MNDLSFCDTTRFIKAKRYNLIGLYPAVVFSYNFNEVISSSYLFCICFRVVVFCQTAARGRQ